MIVEAIRWGMDTIHRIYLGGEIVWKMGGELSLSHIADLFTNGYHAMQVGDIIVLTPSDDAVSVLGGSASVLPTTPIHGESHSRTALEGSVFPAAAIYCVVDAASMSQAEVEALIAGAVYICKEEDSCTDPAIHALIAQAVYGSCESDSRTETEADMLVSPAVYGAHSADNGTTAEASAVVAGAVYVGASEDSGTADDVSAVISVAEPLSGEENSETTDAAGMVTADLVPLRVTAESNSASEVDMMTFRASGIVEIDADSESQSGSEAALDFLDIVSLGGLLRLVTTCEIHLMAAPISDVSVKSDSRSDASIVLSFDGVPDAPVEPDWYDHVQTGSNLYIRSAWHFWNDGDAGHIDTDVWYEVRRDGSNLYIRSVDSSWQDGEKAYIDMPVFFAPKRNGNDLYIRSAGSIWTDGNSANIDTDYFLEPVQEGSNLHIRQDILGGE